jgi:hypothetical protein
MTTQYKWLPEQPTTEMVNRVFNKLGKEVDKEFFILMWKMMWQSAAEVEQTPVGYIRQNLDDDGFDCTDFFMSQHIGAIPVYTQPQKQKPLSDEKCWELIHTLSTPNRQHSLLQLQLVRLVEKAHGIGGEK